MPRADLVLAEPPAEPDLATTGERGEVDEPGLDLAQGDAELVDPGDAGLHLVDDALHPEAKDAQFGIARSVGRLGGFRRLRRSTLAADVGLGRRFARARL